MLLLRGHLPFGSSTIGPDQELPRLDDIEEAFSIGEAEDIAHYYYKEPILRQIEDYE